MALQLKQIYKSPLASYIFLGLVGGLSTLAFSPFNIKLIIPFTLATLIYSTVDSKNILISAEGSYAQSAKWSDDESKGFIKLLGQSTSTWAKLHK